MWTRGRDIYKATMLKNDVVTEQKLLNKKRSGKALTKHMFGEILWKS